MNPEVRTAKKWYWWLWLSPLLTIPSLVILRSLDPGYDWVCGGQWRGCDFNLSNMVSNLVAVSCLALWHLVLLAPMLNKESDFVRWHGGQALLLAGIRTAFELRLLTKSLIHGGEGVGALCSIPVLVTVWFFGTLWGQRQAARGDCALMRWTGQGAGLPLPTDRAKPGPDTDLAPLRGDEPARRRAYSLAQSLSGQGKIDEAVRLFQELLLSDATPGLKSKVAQELKRIDWTSEDLTPDLLVAILRFSLDPEQRRAAVDGLDRLGFVEAL